MITLADLPNLKKKWKKAITEKQIAFTYKGQPVLVTYAKYLIEYLEHIKNNLK